MLQSSVQRNFAKHQWIFCLQKAYFKMNGNKRLIPCLEPNRD